MGYTQEDVVKTRGVKPKGFSPKGPKVKNIPKRVKRPKNPKEGRSLRGQFK